MTPVSAFESNLVVETAPPSGDAAVAASAKPRKPRVWTAFAAFFAAAIVGQSAFYASVVAVGIVAGIILGARGVDPATIGAQVQQMVQQPLPLMLLWLVPFQLGMTAVALFAAWRSRQPLKERLGLVPASGRTLSGLRLASLAGFTIAAALATVLGTSLLLGPPPSNTPIASVLNDGSWWTIMLLSILLSVIPALVEEILFRGYIQRRFLERWSPAVAIGVSTLLFAAMHIDSLQHILAVVPLGVVTGLLAYRTNSVKPGMLVHAIHNASAVGFGALATALSPHFGETGVGLAMIGAIGVLGLAGLPAVISLLRAKRPSTEPALSSELSLTSYLTDSRLGNQTA